MHVLLLSAYVCTITQAVVPYVLAKLEQLHLDATLDTSAATNSGRGTRAVLAKLYPYIHFMWEVQCTQIVVVPLFQD